MNTAKLKRYTITPQGDVVECSKFATEYTTVHAATKADATRKLLVALRHMDENRPSLYIRNGAFCLVQATLEGGFVADSGSISRASKETGRVFPLCSSGGHSSQERASQDSNFAYYASEEYQSNERAAV